MPQTVKNLPAMWEARLDPWVGKIPCRRAQQPTPVFLPEESHGQRNLVSYSPWGCKESEMTERLNTHIKSIAKINKVFVNKLLRP